MHGVACRFVRTKLIFGNEVHCPDRINSGYFSQDIKAKVLNLGIVIHIK